MLRDSAPDSSYEGNHASCLEDARMRHELDADSFQLQSSVVPPLNLYILGLL
jgi:hypothetical protein